MPFSGQFDDYELTLSLDGQTLLLNSTRPLHGDTIVHKNNTWLSLKKNSSWQEAVSLNLNIGASEELYPPLSIDIWCLWRKKLLAAKVNMPYTKLDLMEA